MKVSEFLSTVSNNMPSDISEGFIINWINYLEDDLYSRIIGNLYRVRLMYKLGKIEQLYIKWIRKVITCG